MKTWIKKSFLLTALVVGLGLILTGRVTAQTYTNVHLFMGYPGDGANPQGGLILSGNTLYGTTSGGGTNGNGTVFRVNTDGSNCTNLYSFTTEAFNGGHILTNRDGANPAAGLYLSGHTLYGTAPAGGGFGFGTVFRVNTDGTDFTNLYNFTGGNDGAVPLAGLILSSNTLYGTAQQGGNSGYGTVFAINTDGSNFTNLYSFTVEAFNDDDALTNCDGANPVAGLILAANTLYGTAFGGGSGGNGTVFAVNTDGSNFTNLYSFTAGVLNGEFYLTNSDGANPAAGLILAGNTLYGTAHDGGSFAAGTVFAVNTDGSNFTNLYTFTDFGDYDPNSDGASPQAGLFLSGHTLYGTTVAGGGGNGTVFQVNTDGSDFTNLYSFATFGGSGNGATPDAGLILSSNTLYGTTFGGGTNGNGTVFALSVSLPGDQGIYSYTAFKTAVYAQTNGTPPVAVDPSGPYYFGVQYFADNTNVITDGVTFITPADTNYTFVASYVDYFAVNSDYFYTKTDMDNAFPDGLYLFSINQDNVYSDLTLPSNELYSVSIPAFTGTTWTNLQSLDPGQIFTLNWNNFTPHPSVTSAFVFVRILDVAANSYVYFDSFLPSGTTGINLPAETLDFNSNYRIELLFSDRSDVLNAGFGGEAEATAGFDNLTYTYFTTIPLILNIAPAGPDVVLSWTNSVSDYSLQSTHDLTSGCWQSVTNSTVVIGNQIVLTNVICGRDTFFRLEKSQ
jgi:uncharacterized repeat protein (TIGR03803 family)